MQCVWLFLASFHLLVSAELVEAVVGDARVEVELIPEIYTQLQVELTIFYTRQNYMKLWV